MTSKKRRGTRTWCPHCEAIHPTHAAKPEQFGLPRERRNESDKYHDIQWFRRARVCDSCENHFITGELSEDLISELVDLRNRAAEMLKPKAERAIRARMWLSRKETIPRDLAQKFVRATAWWLTHASGPVRAPRHADRIFLSSRHGWAIEFGANSFLVGKALERSRERIHGFYDRIKAGDIPRRSEVEKAIRAAVAGSVSNHLDEEYWQYPDHGRDLVFGAQSIDLTDAANFVIENSGISDFLSPG